MTRARTESARSERGAALLVAIASVAILTAVAVDLAYNTRVSLQAAVNARDELRATYLAKSAVAMSRLVLHFQQQLDAASSAVAGVQQAATTMTAGQTQGAPAAAGMLAGMASMLPTIGLRLWDLVPVDSSSAALFLGGGLGGAAAPKPQLPILRAAVSAAPDGGRGAAPAPSEAAQGERRAFGDIEGSFHATIQDEDRKINIRQFDSIGAFPSAQALRMAQLVKDAKWDFLFDEEDANGLRVSRMDLFGALKDWEDEDEVSSIFTGNPLRPFDPGFGDENALYDRLPDRYHAKNAPYDSLDELYMVAGVSDAFMAAFGDRLTVYPDLAATINVNTDDPDQMMVNALLMSDPPGLPQPVLADPAFTAKLQAALALAKPLPFMAITPQQFAGVLQALGVKVQPLYLQALDTDMRSPFGDRSSTFRIRAVGVAGDVQKTIEAVVTFDRRAEGLAQDLGRLLHWREE